MSKSIKPCKNKSSSTLPHEPLQSNRGLATFILNECHVSQVFKQEISLRWASFSGKCFAVFLYSYFVYLLWVGPGPYQGLTLAGVFVWAWIITWSEWRGITTAVNRFELTSTCPASFGPQFNSRLYVLLYQASLWTLWDYIYVITLLLPAQSQTPRFWGLGCSPFCCSPSLRSAHLLFQSSQTPQAQRPQIFALPHRHNEAPEEFSTPVCSTAELGCLWNNRSSHLKKANLLI